MKKFYFLLLALGLFTGVNAQIINFPDANFKAKLLAANSNVQIAYTIGNGTMKIDTNNDGEIQVSEALQVYGLNVSDSSILSLEGIASFRNLIRLTFDNNQVNSLTALTGLTNLENLYCSNNQFTSIDFSNLPSLKNIGCVNNQISSVNFNGLNNVTSLDISNNQLTSLDLSSLILMDTLRCNNNLLTSLNINNLVNLRTLAAYSNQLTSLQTNHLVNLEYFTCAFNQIATLDFSSSSRLRNINCIGNTPLTSLFIKNGSMEDMMFFNIANNPNLRYICADEAQLLDIQGEINQERYTQCHTNSYCTFTPGGTFYRILGRTKFDEDGNGCNISDSVVPNLKLNITNGVSSGSVIPNATGDYVLPVSAGTHTITPVFEGQSYFSVSPPSVTVTFPGTSGLSIQDFCITPNQSNPDLEISVLPLTNARPGFDAAYKVVYKNKGSVRLSGTVKLTFNDAVVDLIASTPVAANQTMNNLSWDFIDLLPFETRVIDVTFNLNSPTETPAVVNGMILNYTAALITFNQDNTENDNVFQLNQTVVGSFDPNDKTCLEGKTITPEKVGDYVHYMIRFENTGTANAQNIVVKDMIDLAKFDMATLVPMKGSHSFVTRITETNKVEFIFENINLPFDNANNDGYVAFKIKTKPTLVLGNTFSNTASIYFDYNFPIVTNTATTTITALSKQDFVFSHYFKLYPNPVNDVLNITTKETITISSVSIYNTLGQLVVVIPNAQNIKTIDVSNLSSGNYFIKINSDKGSSNTKFIKQ
jgi:Leucine-rich repeat (LRR) protein